MRNSLALSSCLALWIFIAIPAMAETGKSSSSTSLQESDTKKQLLKKTQKGKASYYGKEFYGKQMADGTKMDPTDNVAASRTLPLGTEAKVTNLENGRSEIVEIRDRGPYVDGRIVDVSPSTAEKLGFKEDGVVAVEVQPITIPDKNANRNNGKND